MPISDEQKQAALKELESHLGKRTPAFIENLTKIAADEGVYGDDLDDCIIQAMAYQEFQGFSPRDRVPCCKKSSSIHSSSIPRGH
ncbi:hypothetical protein V495_06816 [Pseudogymnoascus sp. VKM F-4514 (FW-929)]|nr:hypothetical protein V495_06816 [Pseudogymnoascus sp. VKM F-4514 (FW-929)]KFY62972.1 hypothetical protein V497_02131 [Pseudogymnoascus sp. VKM F-4516 (FW-969)]